MGKNSQLLDICRSSNGTDELKTYIKNKCKFDRMQKYDLVAAAIQAKNYDVAAMLIDFGVGNWSSCDIMLIPDINIINKILGPESYMNMNIYDAVANNYNAVVKTIINISNINRRFGEHQQTYLMYSIKVLNFEIALYLIEKGARVNFCDVYKRNELYYLMCDDYYYYQDAGKVAQVHKLLDMFIEHRLDFDIGNILTFAIEFGNYTVAEYLIMHGIGLNEYNEQGKYKIPLLAACSGIRGQVKRSIKLFELLVDAGSKVYGFGHDCVKLFLSMPFVEFGDFKRVMGKFVAKYGLNGAVDEHGHSLLFCVRNKAQYDVFVSLGVDEGVRDGIGQTALEYLSLQKYYI